MPSGDGTLNSRFLTVSTIYEKSISYQHKLTYLAEKKNFRKELFVNNEVHLIFKELLKA